MYGKQQVSSQFWRRSILGMLLVLIQLVLASSPLPIFILAPAWLQYFHSFKLRGKKGAWLRNSQKQPNQPIGDNTKQKTLTFKSGQFIYVSLLKRTEMVAAQVFKNESIYTFPTKVLHPSPHTTLQPDISQIFRGFTEMMWRGMGESPLSKNHVFPLRITGKGQSWMRHPLVQKVWVPPTRRYLQYLALPPHPPALSLVTSFMFYTCKDCPAQEFLTTPSLYVYI